MDNYKNIKQYSPLSTNGSHYDSYEDLIRRNTADPYLPGLTAQDRADWEKQYADIIAGRRVSGQTDQDIDRLYYDFRFAQTFGVNNLNKFSEKDRDTILAKYYELSEAEKKEMQGIENFINTANLVKNTNDNTFESRVSKVKQQQEEERIDKLGFTKDYILEKESELDNQLSKYDLTPNDRYSIDRLIKQGDYLSSAEDLIKKVTGENPKLKTTEENANSFDFISDDGSSNIDTEVLTDFFNRTSRTDEEVESFEEKSDKSENYTKFDRYNNILKLNKDGKVTHDSSKDKTLQDITNYQNSKNELIQSALGQDYNMNLSNDKFYETYKISKDEVYEDLSKEIPKSINDLKNLALMYSNYYKAFQEYDKCAFDDATWAKIYLQYEAIARSKDKNTANAALDKLIQVEAEDREGYGEKIANTLFQFSANVAGSFINLAGYSYGLGEYLTGRYEKQEGLSEFENALNAITIDNDIVRFGNDLIETGTLFDMQKFKELGINKYMITNPNQELSWSKTPFEAVGQHGFTVASMLMSYGLGVVGKYLGKGASRLLANALRIKNELNPAAQQQLLRAAVKFGGGVEKGFNGMAVPMLVGAPEASSNASQTRETVLREATAANKQAMNKEFNEKLSARMNERLPGLFEEQFNNYLKQNPTITQEQAQAAAETIQKQIEEQIWNSTLDEVYNKYNFIDAQTKYAAARAGLNTFYMTAFLNGSLNGTLKSSFMAAPVKKQTDLITKKIFGTRSSKFNVSIDANGNKIVTPKAQLGDYFTRLNAKSIGWKQFGDNKFTRFLDSASKYSSILMDNISYHAAKKGKEAIGEGLEEYFQGVFQGVSESAAMYNINSFINNKYSGDGSAQLYSYQAGTMSEAMKALDQELISKENIHAGILGALSTLIPGRLGGGSKRNKNQNPVYETDENGNILTDDNGNPIPKNRKWYNKAYQWSRTNLVENLLYAPSKIQEMHSIANNLSELLNNEEYKAKFEGLNGIISFGEIAKLAAEADDQFGYRNSLFGSLVSQAAMLSKLQGTEYHQEVMDYLSKFANLDTSTNAQGEFTNPETAALFEQIAKNVEYKQLFDMTNPVEVIKKIRENASNFIETIQTVEKRSKEIDDEFGSEVDEDVKNSLIWGELSIKNYDKRAKSLKEKISSVKNQISTTLRQSEAQHTNPNISNSDKRTLIELGSKEHILKQKQAITEKIEKLKKDIAEIEKDKNPTSDVRKNYNKKLRELAQEKNKLKLLQKSLSKEFISSEEDYVFSAEEILQMDSISRAQMLDATKYAFRSKAQQKEIDRLTDAIKQVDLVNGSDTATLSDIIDLGKLELGISQFSTDYDLIKNDPSRFNQFYRRAKMDQHRLVLQAQATSINSSKTYEDYINRMELFFKNPENPQQLMDIMMLNSMLDRNNKFYKLFNKNENFIDGISKFMMQKVNEGVYNEQEMTLVIEALNWTANHVGMDFNLQSLEEYLKPGYGNIITHGGEFLQHLEFAAKDELKKYLESLADFEHAQSLLNEINKLVWKVVKNYNFQQKSKLVNQKIEIAEPVITNESAAPVTAPTPVENKPQEEQKEEQESQEENLAEKIREERINEFDQILEMINKMSDSVVWKDVILKTANNFKSKLKSSEEVYDSKQEMLNSFKDSFKNENMLVQVVVENILGKTFETSKEDQQNQTSEIEQVSQRAAERRPASSKSNEFAVLFEDNDIENYLGAVNREALGIYNYLSNNEVKVGTEIYFAIWNPKDKVEGMSSNDYPIVALIKVGDKYQAIGVLPRSQDTTMDGYGHIENLKAVYNEQIEKNFDENNFSLITYQGQPVTSNLMGSNIKLQDRVFVDQTKKRIKLTNSRIVPGWSSRNDRSTNLQEIKKNADEILANLEVVEDGDDKKLVFNNNGVKQNVFQNEITSEEIETTLDLLDKATRDQRIQLESEAAFLLGANQTIITAGKNLKKLLNDKKLILEEEDDGVPKKDISDDIKTILKSLYIKNVDVVIKIEDGVRKIVIDENTKIDIGKPGESTTKVCAKVIAEVLQSVIKQSGKPVKYQIDYQKINEIKDLYAKEGDLTDANWGYLQNVLERYAFIDSSSLQNDVVNVRIPVPSNMTNSQNNQAEKNRTADLNEQLGQSRQRPEQLPENSEKPGRVAEQIAQNIVSQSDAVSLSATTVATTKEYTGQQSVAPSSIGNSVDSLVKDIADDTVAVKYPNMTSEVSDEIEKQVNDILANYLAKGYSVYAGGVKRGMPRWRENRRLYLLYNKDAEYDGKPIKLQIKCELDLLLINPETGHVIIIDTKTIRRPSIHHQDLKDKKQQYINQLSIYKYALAQQKTIVGENVEFDNIDIALLTVPMDYAFQEELNYTVIDGQLYLDDKEYNDAKLLKNSKVELTIIDKKNISSEEDIVKEAIKKNKQILNQSVEAQAEQQAYNNNEDQDAIPPKPIVDETVTQEEISEKLKIEETQVEDNIGNNGIFTMDDMMLLARRAHNSIASDTTPSTREINNINDC